MAYTERYGNYVKFLRGTPAAWATLESKDSDTLYFIAEPDATRGKLYLGSKLISDGDITQVSQLNQLNDVLVAEGVLNNSLLVYDEAKKAWVNKPVSVVLSTIVSVMTGADAENDGATGLVPTPTKGQQNLFLRGDATWADPTAQVAADLAALNNSVDLRFTKLYAGDNQNSSIRDIAAAEVAKVVASAPEDFDTLQEIAKWIQDHDSVVDVAEAENRLEAVEKAVFGTEAKTDEEGNIITPATEGLVTTVAGLTETVNGTNGLVTQVNTLNLNYTLLAGKVSGMEEDIDDLQEKTEAIDQRLKWVDLVNEE